MLSIVVIVAAATTSPVKSSIGPFMLMLSETLFPPVVLLTFVSRVTVESFWVRILMSIFALSDDMTLVLSPVLID